MRYGVYFDNGESVHFTRDVRYERIKIEDASVLVIRYQRNGEKVDTIMPLANVTFITEED